MKMVDIIFLSYTFEFLETYWRWKVETRWFFATFFDRERQCSQRKFTFSKTSLILLGNYRFFRICLYWIYISNILEKTNQTKLESWITTFGRNLHERPKFLEVGRLWWTIPKYFHYPCYNPGADDPHAFQSLYIKSLNDMFCTICFFAVNICWIVKYWMNIAKSKYIAALDRVTVLFHYIMYRKICKILNCRI